MYLCNDRGFESPPGHSNEDFFIIMCFKAEPPARAAKPALPREEGEVKQTV